jgi:hypothetical protein
MKGKLKKIGEEWIVTYDTFQNDHSYPFPAYKIIPLHPDDIKEIEVDSKIFDNIEARIAAYPEVEFEIKYYWDETMEQPIDVAKLIKTEYPELEGTMNLCNDITKKRTGKMTEEEWQEAERAQTSTKTTESSIIWFIDRLSKVVYNPLDVNDYPKAIEKLYAQAIEMHKQEILEAYKREAAYMKHAGCSDDQINKSAEQYYQQKFKSI